ncbi:hypothetical protein SUS17_1640 [Sphingomonas sp. S17]|nr:hypothetical protein SUS17_1640 [Sphingomonas sp. S17]
MFGVYDIGVNAKSVMTAGRHPAQGRDMPHFLSRCDGARRG